MLHLGSTNPSTSGIGNNVIIAIVVTVLVVIATALSAVTYLLCRRKLGEKKLTNNFQNAAFTSDTPENIELPKIPEDGYEEPAQLDSSRRDSNYQSLN